MAIQKITTDIIEDNAVTGTKISVGTPAAGDIFYYDGTDYTKLPIGTPGQTLALESGLPIWGVGTGGIPSGALPGFPFHGNHWQYGGHFGGVAGNTILYHSFTSDNHAIVGHNAAVGPTTAPSISSATQGMNSSTEAYVIGNASPFNGSHCEKFAFASATTAQNGGTDICSTAGTTTTLVFGQGDVTCESETHGYIGGGRSGEIPSFGYAIASSPVRKIEFATGTFTEGLANLSDTKAGQICVSGQTHAYWGGGHYGHQNSQNPYPTTSIDRFTFASDSMQGSWDNLGDDRGSGGIGHSTTTHGYFYAGHSTSHSPTPGVQVTTIEQISFASAGQGTSHGDIATVGRTGMYPGQTQTHGYEICGQTYVGTTGNPSVALTTVNGYSFASNTTAAQTADLGITVENASSPCQAPTFSFS